VRRLVASQLSGPHEWDVTPQRSRILRNRRIVGGENDSIEHPVVVCLESGFDGVRNEWLARERLQVLAGDAFGATSRGDDTERGQRTGSTACAAAS
jgi:hypothetical protein